MMTALECKECGAPVEAVNGELVRSCDHLDATVIANLTAHATGESKVAA